MVTSSELAERMKADILRDVLAGIVPRSVAGFADLHDYVDANTYGGTEVLLDQLTAAAPQTDTGAHAAMSRLIELMNPAIDAVDHWIKDDGIVRGIGTAEPTSVIPRTSDELAMQSNMAAIDRLVGPTKYRHIVAWGKWLGFTPVTVRDYILFAERENAPTDVLQKLNGTWVTVSDIVNDENRRRVDELAGGTSANSVVQSVQSRDNSLTP